MSTLDVFVNFQDIAIRDITSTTTTMPNDTTIEIDIIHDNGKAKTKLLLSGPGVNATAWAIANFALVHGIHSGQAV